MENLTILWMTPMNFNKMKTSTNRLRRLLSLGLISLLLVGCKQQDEPQSTESQVPVFHADLSLEMDIDREISIIDQNAALLEEGEMRSLIGFERKANKVEAKFDSYGSENDKVQVTIELRHNSDRNAVYVAQTDAKVLAEKKIELRGKDLAFKRLGNDNQRANLDTNQRTGWEMRLSIGGTLDMSAWKLRFEDTKELTIVPENGAVNLASYKGKIPFVSDWTSLEGSLGADNRLALTTPTKTSTSGQTSYVATKLRPYGNFLRIQIYNEGRQNIIIKKIFFKSDDVVSQGALALSENDSNWSTTANRKMQQVESAELSRTLAKGGTPLVALLWVAPRQLGSNDIDTYTEIRVSFAEQNSRYGGITYEKMLAYSRYGRGNLPRAKSTPLNVRLGSTIAVQPIVYMARNFLWGDPTLTSTTQDRALRFASTYYVDKRDVSTGEVGSYYSPGEAKVLTEAGEKNRLNLEGARWRVATRNDIAGVFPLFDNNNHWLSRQDGKLIEKEETIQLPEDPAPVTYKSLYFRPAGAGTDGGPTDVLYGLRFLDANKSPTKYTAAFRYERAGDWRENGTQNTNAQSTIDITVRPLGSWGTGSVLPEHFFQNIVAKPGYWTSDNEHDHKAKLPARGYQRGGSWNSSDATHSNGYILAFWRDKQQVHNERNDRYQIQRATDPAFTFYTNRASAVINKQNGMPILLFRKP